MKRHLNTARMDRLRMATAAARPDRPEFSSKGGWCLALGYKDASGPWRLAHDGFTDFDGFVRRLRGVMQGDGAYILRLALWLCGEGDDGEMPRPGASDSPPVAPQAAQPIDLEALRAFWRAQHAKVLNGQAIMPSDGALLLNYLEAAYREKISIIIEHDAA